MEASLIRQKRCAVYELDKIAHETFDEEIKMECKYKECPALVKLCADGITNIISGPCSTLEHAESERASFSPLNGPI